MTNSHRLENREKHDQSSTRSRTEPGSRRFFALSLAALGVVYGDIGTSPLYALRECFFGSHSLSPEPANVLGVLSLVFWALTLVISIKYLLFLMRADNRGEGGIMALLALLTPRKFLTPGQRRYLLPLGLFGAALLYGDGAITPAISVLSAVEGLKIAAPGLEHFVVPITLLILVSLFRFQRRGTAGVGAVYFVPAGLYAIGNPTADDPVIVTANYKMTYDIIRHILEGRNVWLLVLETYGINVWCAAGKGTFGTDELVRRIEATGLSKIVSHRRLILPILGAPGIAAHKVLRQSGFFVCYSTIRAEDLPEFLDNSMKTTPAMQELTFTLYERLVLIPVEVVLVMKTLCIWGAMLFLAVSLASGAIAGLTALIALIGAVLTGVALTPILLPWVPGRSFAVKGMITGLFWCLAFFLLADGIRWSPATTIASFLALPAISAFYALNFTGCTGFTSRSGVKKEMRIALPIMGCAALASLLLLIAGKINSLF